MYAEASFKVRGLLSTPFSIKHFSEAGFEGQKDETAMRSSLPGMGDTMGDDDDDDAIDLIQTDPISQQPEYSEEDMHSRRECGVDEVERLIIADPISGKQNKAYLSSLLLIFLRNCNNITTFK